MTPSDTEPPPRQRTDLTRYAWWSVAAALATIVLKVAAWWVTGSVGLLADAAESLVNLVAALVALYTLWLAAKPADSNHHFGHTKAEYFSVAVEGLLIVVAAGYILWSSWQRFWDPQPLEQVGFGLVISLVAAALNGAVAWLLIRAGKRHRSRALVADGRHLLTDLWTSVGVVVGVAAVALTGWDRLDAIVAFLVGLNIVRVGWDLLSESAGGLMDQAWPDDDQRRLAALIKGHATEHVSFHGLRTREAGHSRYAEVHVLVPGSWTVQRGHHLSEQLEDDVARSFDGAHLLCHVEPREDPRSYNDYDTEIDMTDRDEPTT